MTEIKSKKRSKRIAKSKNRKALVYKWIDDFHKIFHYYPLPGLQEFIEQSILAAEQRGYEKGVLDEGKAHQDLVNAVMVWHHLWMQDPAEKGKESVSALELINWKLKSEYNRGIMEAIKKADGGTTLPIAPTGTDIQTETGGGSPQAGDDCQKDAGRRADDKDGDAEADQVGDKLEGQLGGEKET